MRIKELEELVKKSWIHSDQWRLRNGRIEFSIETTGNYHEFFDICLAPTNVEIIVRKWVELGGLNNIYDKIRFEREKECHPK